jgi:hypothetical protein
MMKFFRWLTKYNKSRNISTLLSLIIFMMVFLTYKLFTPQMNVYFAISLIFILFFVNRLLEELFRRILGTRNVEIKERYFIFALILFVTVNTFII